MANISDKRGKHTPSIQGKDEISQLIITHIQKFHHILVITEGLMLQIDYIHVPRFLYRAP